jgi:hypothetical protein
MATVVEKKLAFKVPAEALEPEKAKRLVVVPGAMVGTWMNVDHATRGLLKIVVATSGPGITVHAYGSCTPTPCDWGVVPAVLHAADVSSAAPVAFSAKYKFPFKETEITGVLDHGALIVETFEKFTDRSGRSNYHTKAYFAK